MSLNSNRIVIINILVLYELHAKCYLVFLLGYLIQPFLDRSNVENIKNHTYEMPNFRLG